MNAGTLRRRSRVLCPAAWRAAWWAWSALRRARAELPEQGVRTRLAPPPARALDGEIGVRIVLRTVAPTCLERSLVLQTWLAARGAEVDIIIGVPRGGTRPLSRSNSAHAWLANETTPVLVGDYAVLGRINAGPPAAGR